MIQHYTAGANCPVKLASRYLFWTKKGKIKREVTRKLLRRFKQELSARLKKDHPNEKEFPQLVATPVFEFSDSWAMGMPGHMGAYVHVLFQTSNIHKWSLVLDHLVVFAFTDVFSEVMWEIEGWTDE